MIKEPERSERTSALRHAPPSTDSIVIGSGPAMVDLKSVKSAVSRVIPYGGAIVRTSGSRAMVALTFDDGPDPDTTPAVCDVLDRHGARGTFFFVGRNATEYPAVAENVAARGHEVANHGYEHRSAGWDPGMSGWRSQVRQIKSGADAIGPQASRLFRPPFGHESGWTRAAAIAARHRLVGWSDAPIDWTGDGAGALVTRLRSAVRPGGIVLLHDGLEDAMGPEMVDRQPTIDALEVVLTELRGITSFVTLSELLEHGRPLRRLRPNRPITRMP
jgi:peptidoglycan/xylan/chitin deacetylase (PgdA/CDA1 family)